MTTERLQNTLTSKLRTIAKLREDNKIMRGALDFIYDECDWEDDTRIGQIIAKTLNQLGE